MIRGVIFDLDGVLVSTDELHHLSWDRLARQEGIPYSRKINRRMLGVGRMECLEILLERASRTYSPEEKQALADQKNAWYRESLAAMSSGDALPGVGELLRALRDAGILLAVGSSSRNAPLIMESLGMTEMVDIIVDGSQVEKAKPEPDIFLLAAKRLGLAPVECIVVEDAPAGVEAARRAGMTVLAVGPPELHPDAEFRVDSLAKVTAELLISKGVSES